MKLRGETFNKIDSRLTKWMASKGLIFLRWSIGIIFLWFGGLKFFKGMSPAEELAILTIQQMSFGIISEQMIIYGLAAWEVLIGVGLLFNLFLRETLLLLFLLMIGTFLPVFLFPDKVFAIFPYSLTLKGQSIIKNLVIVSAGIVLGSTVRGGKFEASPR